MADGLSSSNATAIVQELVGRVNSWTPITPLSTYRSASIDFKVGNIFVSAPKILDMSTSFALGLGPDGMAAGKLIFDEFCAPFGLNGTNESKAARIKTSVVSIIFASSWLPLHFQGSALGINPLVLEGTGPMIWINAAKTNSLSDLVELLVHEIGHVLGLHHVQHGLLSQQGPECGKCKPEADSYSTGDFIGDTVITPAPGYPMLNSSSNGTCGYSANPASCASIDLGAATNVMSYFECKGVTTGFTLGQLARIRCVLDMHLSTGGVPNAVQKAAHGLGLKYPSNSSAGLWAWNDLGLATQPPAPTSAPAPTSVPVGTSAPTDTNGTETTAPSPRSAPTAAPTKIPTVAGTRVC